MHATGWSRGLEVSGGGTGVVSHAGLVLLRSLADRTGLTSGLSSALPSPLGGHDRGRVFADLACAIADGARVISDFRVMGDQLDAAPRLGRVEHRSRPPAPAGRGDRRAAARAAAQADDHSGPAPATSWCASSTSWPPGTAARSSTRSAGRSAPGRGPRSARSPRPPGKPRSTATARSANAAVQRARDRIRELTLRSRMLLPVK